MRTLEGKVAIVTGAGQGVGEGIAVALADAGAAVVASGRTESKVERTATTIAERGGTAVAMRCDVTDADDIRACVDRTVAELGTVDILVNNAQVPPLGPIAEIPEALFVEGWQTGPLATFRFPRCSSRKPKVPRPSPSRRAFPDFSTNAFMSKVRS